MARPVVARRPSEHIAALSKMLRQIEVDDELQPKRKAAISRAIGVLITELHKDALASTGAPSAGGQ